jgi:hypothetical protein
MKILAVNIHNQLDNDLSVLDATKRAWLLDENKFDKNLPDFVIGVANGVIKGHFRFIGWSKDKIEPNRLEFTLEYCTDAEKVSIDNFTKDKNLKYFVTKQRW